LIHNLSLQSIFKYDLDFVDEVISVASLENLHKSQQDTRTFVQLVLLIAFGSKLDRQLFKEVLKFA